MGLNEDILLNMVCSLIELNLLKLGHNELDQTSLKNAFLAQED